MRVIQSPNLASAHKQVVQYVGKHCYKDENGNPILYPGENNKTTIEAPPVTLVCKTPCASPMFVPSEEFAFAKILGTQRFNDEYAHDLIYGKPEAKHEYSYNERLRHWCHTQMIDATSNTIPSGFDQIQYCIDKLKNPNTRRAVASTWYPFADWHREDVPCLQFVHFLIRNGKMDMEVLFRSEDMLYGAGSNMYGLVRLGEYVATGAGVPFGTYTHIALCPHVYTTDAVDLEVFGVIL